MGVLEIGVQLTWRIGVRKMNPGGEGGSLFLTHVRGQWIWNKVVTVVIEERVDLREPGAWD